MTNMTGFSHQNRDGDQATKPQSSNSSATSSSPDLVFLVAIKSLGSIVNLDIATDSNKSLQCLCIQHLNSLRSSLHTSSSHCQIALQPCSSIHIFVYS